MNIKSSYRSEIDGIRAFAVIAVIIYHFNESFLKSGFLGVDIFFVISGYVITLSFLRMDDKNFLQFISSFYKKRIKRLLPSLLVYVIIISLFVCFFVEDGRTIFFRTGFFSLFGLSNLYLVRNSVDYFAFSTNFNPFTQTWSLAIEQQFYLIYPLLIWFTGFNKTKNYTTNKLTFSILLITSISLIYFLSFYSDINTDTYFLLQYRFWEIGSGCLLLIFIKKNNNLIKKLQNIPPGLTLTLIILLMLLPKEMVLISIPSVVILTLLLIISLKEKGLIFKIFTHQKILYLGKLSYSLYLWHWGVIAMSLWTIGIHWWSIPIQVFLIITVSIISFEFIEKPIQNKLGFESKTISKWISSISLLIFSLTPIFLDKFENNFLFLGKKNRLNNYSETELWNRNNCSNSSISNGDVPNQLDFNKCWITKENHVRKKIKDTKQRIFFYGNSYNEHIAPIPAAIVKKRNDLQFNSFFTNTGCIPSDIITPKNNRNIECKSTFKNYLNFFDNYSKEGDLFIISSSFFPLPLVKKNLYLKNNTEISNRDAQNIYLEELKAIHIRLKKKGKGLVVVSPIPTIQNNPRLCAHWFAKTNNQCSSNKLFNNEANLTIDQNLQQYINLERIGIKYLNIYSELFKILNNNQAKIYLYYYDKSHLSREGSLKLVDFFEKEVLTKQ